VVSLVYNFRTLFLAEGSLGIEAEERSIIKLVPLEWTFNIGFSSLHVSFSVIDFKAEISVFLDEEVRDFNLGSSSWSLMLARLIGASYRA
jgi:hypothetical protein